MVWVRSLEVADVRNIVRASVELGPGLNVFVGDNAQGKTSVLETMALLARGRSFRSDDRTVVIRRGASRSRVAAQVHGVRDAQLEVELSEAGRRFAVDGRAVRPAEYLGRLDVVVYSTERLKVVRGGMRERRQFLDRAAGALWPSYRALSRDYEKVVRQRNACLEGGGRGMEAWDERLVALGGELRARRAEYARRLDAALGRGYRPNGERYHVALAPDGEEPVAVREALWEQLRAWRDRELRARRCLIGPHRDTVVFGVDGVDAAESASAGQARSLLLALCLSALAVHDSEAGHPAVALLDDLDSELDEARTRELCGVVAARGQALVTTAHRGWVRRLDGAGRVFEVAAGRVGRAA